MTMYLSFFSFTLRFITTPIQSESDTTLYLAVACHWDPDEGEENE